MDKGNDTLLGRPLSAEQQAERRDMERRLEKAGVVAEYWLAVYVEGAYSRDRMIEGLIRSLDAIGDLPPDFRHRMLGKVVETAFNIAPPRRGKGQPRTAVALVKLANGLLEMAQADHYSLSRETTQNSAFTFVAEILRDVGIADVQADTVYKWRYEKNND